MSTIRFTWLRPGGWTRMGMVGAVAVMFATPMLWSLGVFAPEEEELRRALIFLASGMWLFVALGYGAGWVLRGFVVRSKEGEDGDDGHHHAPSPPPAAHKPPAHH
ncbi:hypothetical protein [Magnetospirillum sp. UT-4]|uniref:hypothetical protein n=1 Tax=Magnetospirillum sp. UT-4 TaxID=2681467 RepID=UPI00137DC346|nr:hypothetical protein [Magnetospirillum sp. UT-4]CAA7623375.1 conserved hypothetical protein [Magnetospirillum sp. UT-4]